MRPGLIAFGIILAGTCHSLCARPVEKLQVVKLTNGPNRIGLPGLNVLCWAVLSHRENFNAHGFDIFSLQMKEAGQGPNPNDWMAVTFFDDNKEQFVLTVGGGADCLLHDFRLLRDHGGKIIQLILADRELTGSYVDKETVTFSFYELKKNIEGLVGYPLFYFQRVRVQTAREKYCDVGEAFKVELGLSNYMVRRQ
jgi:hypothetical protein